MSLVGRHSGDGATASDRRLDLSVAAAGSSSWRCCVTVTLVAWGVLVYAAIDFGGDARGGESTAWVFLGLATVGAAACLFVTLLLGARIVALVQGPYGAGPPPGWSASRSLRLRRRPRPGLQRVLARSCQDRAVGSAREVTMSKLDAQRAMREAKYARDSASGPTRREAAAAAAGGAPVAPSRPAAASPRRRGRRPLPSPRPPPRPRSAAVTGR